MNQHVEKTNKLITGGGHIVWSLKGLRVHPTLQIVHMTPFFWSQGPQGGVPWFSHIRLGMQTWLPMRPFSMAMAHTSSIKTNQTMERLRTLLQVYMAYIVNTPNIIMIWKHQPLQISSHGSPGHWRALSICSAKERAVFSGSRPSGLSVTRPGARDDEKMRGWRWMDLRCFWLLSWIFMGVLYMVYLHIFITFYL